MGRIPPLPPGRITPPRDWPRPGHPESMPIYDDIGRPYCPHCRQLIKQPSKPWIRAGFFRAVFFGVFKVFFHIDERDF